MKDMETNEVCDALELSVLFLRGIVKTHPDVLQDHDVEAFIMNVLNPAKVAARKWHNQLRATERILERHEMTLNAPAHEAAKPRGC